MLRRNFMLEAEDHTRPLPIYQTNFERMTAWIRDLRSRRVDPTAEDSNETEEEEEQKYEDTEEEEREDTQDAALRRWANEDDVLADFWEKHTEMIRLHEQQERDLGYGSDAPSSNIGNSRSSDYV